MVKPQHMGGCQNYGPFLGTLNIRCRIIIGIQKGTVILTTTHRSLVVGGVQVVAHDDIRLGIIIPNPGEDKPKCLIFGSSGEPLVPRHHSQLWLAAEV